ncbi:CPCC family cysteine-rich protein [Nonomuraea sp. SBT364]|uniref:CPCC family cysteine-rich protein n=1 Tax=Nonomuraea sp. SBT364 TaxID=1580530 RepID=UPI0018CFA93B|nr:CPCC family cysteine-rich protein [Nonomuraea sp. SBT364]
MLDVRVGKLGVVGLELSNYPVLRGPEGGPYACPCCRYVTLDERGGSEICPVCFWEDDGQDDPDADVVLGGPNGGLSLTQARRNFLAFGACEESMRRNVRAPRPEEEPAS